MSEASETGEAGLPPRKGLGAYVQVLRQSVVLAVRGDSRYYAWMCLLAAVSLIGLNAYCRQLAFGLVVTGLSNQVSWGVYIANFTFLVGMASTAAMLVIPAYVYGDEEMKEVVVFGQILALVSCVMALLFILVDLERPERFWHIIPGIGKFNFPESMLAWDVIALNGYLLLTVYICGYLLYEAVEDRPPRPVLYVPFVFLAIGWAISVHTVTAFLYVGLGSRPFWNSAILGPRFLASAFAAGPAFLILALQAIRRLTRFEVPDSVLLKLRTIVQVAMIISVFLLGCEVFTSFYTGATHVASARYLFFGLHGKGALVPWIWTAVALNLTALILLMLPVSRNLRNLNIASACAILGIWIEKGMGLIVPGFIPTPLGEVVEYLPSVDETLVSFGIWAFGALLFTLLVRVSIPVLVRSAAYRRRHPPEGAPAAV